MTENDTIAAVSTAPGEGGIGIVRISGEKAADILGKLFATPGRKPGSMVFADKTMYYGFIIDPLSAETVDEVLVVFMKGPRSYTGEDVCEIQCHGGIVPIKHILDLVYENGAKPAQPGEFTKRAFLNGRIDLIQAGAVIDLIRSKTSRGYHSAKEQTEGKLSEKVRSIRETLLGILAEIAVRIDYPEAFEDTLPDIENNVISNALERAAKEAEMLIEGADAGRLVRDGVRTVIIGKPNAGKSSLFNFMVREDTAIVASTPGTTRDAIEVWIDVYGIPVLLADTAGIREDADEIESQGIKRAREQYNKADLAIFLLDGNRPLSEEDRYIAQMLDPDKKLIVAINKSDLPQVFGKKEAAEIIPFTWEAVDIIQISLTEDGHKDEKERIGEIERRLEELTQKGAISGSSLLVTRARHKVIFNTVVSEITEAIEEISKGTAYEFAEVNIRAAWEALGEMIGETASDEVIDRVFEEFCVGK